MRLRLFTFLFILVTPSISIAQKSLDTRIVVSVSDTADLYEKVRMAFVDEGIIVVDNRRTDTISTHPFNLKSTSYIIAYAAIQDSKVTIWGYMADANTNMLGITVNPNKNQYKKIFYYKGDKYWKKLTRIAARIPGTISYGKK